MPACWAGPHLCPHSPRARQLFCPRLSLSVWKRHTKPAAKGPDAGHSRPSQRGPWRPSPRTRVPAARAGPREARGRPGVGGSRAQLQGTPPSRSEAGLCSGLPAPAAPSRQTSVHCAGVSFCLLARIDMIVGPPPPSTPRHKKYPTKGPTAPPRESPQYLPRSGCRPSRLSLWNGQPPSLQAT